MNEPSDDDEPRPRVPDAITPVGMARLRAEHTELLRRERPKVVREVADAAAQGDRSENAEYIYGKRRLREIDRRLQFLERRMRLVVVVDPAAHQVRDRVLFGATVVLEDDRGERATWTLVGADEVDVAARRISVHSPVGRALIGKEVDDEVRVLTPGGARTFALVEIAYP